MHDFILDQMPYPINDVEKQIDLGLEGNGGTSHFGKSIQWLAVDHLHQEAIFDVLLCAIILREEVCYTAS